MKRIRIATPAQDEVRAAQEILIDMGVPWGDDTFEIKSGLISHLFADEYAGIRAGDKAKFIKAEQHGYEEVTLSNLHGFDASPFIGHEPCAFSKGGGK